MAELPPSATPSASDSTPPSRPPHSLHADSHAIDAQGEVGAGNGLGNGGSGGVGGMGGAGGAGPEMPKRRISRQLRLKKKPRGGVRKAGAELEESAGRVFAAIVGKKHAKGKGKKKDGAAGGGGESGHDDAAVRPTHIHPPEIGYAGKRVRPSDAQGAGASSAGGAGGAGRNGEEALPVRVKVMLYGPSGHEEMEVSTAQELEAVLTARKEGAGAAAAGAGAGSGAGAAQRGAMWIDVWGLENAEILSVLGRHFGLHRLELEDIVNTHQRSKMESYGEHVYIVVREAFIDRDDDGLDTDQISIALGTDWLLTFQEKHGDCFDPVRERIRHRKGKLCVSGPDALAYSLLDAVIDSYFPVLEYYGERLETIELESTDRPSLKVAHEIHAVKRDLLFMRRAVWPARETVSSLIRDDSLGGGESTDGGAAGPVLIRPETRIYLRDCYDHLVQLIDMLENYREIASGLMDLYHSSMSNRMNEIMKVLTIIATIFMPLSFIAGVYGMNFRTARDGGSVLNMPELDWRFGYPFALGVMALTAGTMLVYFWRKRWMWRE